MSQIAFDLQVFNLVAAAVPPPGGSTNMQFAALGAIGPDLYEYMPISSQLSAALTQVVQQALQSLTSSQIKSLTPPTINFTPITSNPTLQAEAFTKPTMSAYSIVFSQIVVPYWPIFQRDASLLNQLQTAANNQDGGALQSLASSVNQLTGDAAQLKQLVPVLLSVLGTISAIVALPPPIELPAPQMPWWPQINRPFEFLRWHGTSKYAQHLVNSANTPDQQAYAYGHLCHVAASVTGKPFINSIVGGPYRTHWWRNRLVSNFVDAWTYGFYQTSATMSGDTPTPPYANWANVGGANLQNQFNVANLSVPTTGLPAAVTAVASGQYDSLAAQFPQDLATYLQQAITSSYPAAYTPAGFAADMAGNTAAQQAFVGLFAVVWFMTSGFGPLTPFTLGPAPSTCTSPPSWVTSGGSPPSPQSSGPSTGATVCGVVLAILAVILFIFQQWAAGITLVVGAVGAFASGGSINWDQLACNVYWLRQGLLNAQNGILKSMLWSGLIYPMPYQLGIGSGNQPVVDMTASGGVPLTKSMPGGSIWAAGMAYPLQMDTTVGGYADLDYQSYPQSSPEDPQTLSIVSLPPSYPNTIVNGSPAPPGGGILNGAAFPSANVFFGDAVSNAQQLIGNVANLPSYNLDADRGYGWLCWGPALGQYPSNGSVNNPLPE
jgi:hypothetical protein